MSTPKFGELPQMNTQGASLEELRAYVGQLQNHLIKLQRDLKYTLETLDYENIFDVGGWRVSPDQIASKDGDVGMSTEDTAADDIRFWAGDVKTGAPLFYVTKSGKLYAANGEFIGTITGSIITGGQINGSTITGGTIQTAASGNRLEMVSTGLNGYDSAGLKRVSVIKDYGGLAIPAFVLYDTSGVESGSFRSNYASRCDLVGVSNSSLTLASSGAILNGNDVTVQTWLGGSFYWGSEIVATRNWANTTKANLGATTSSTSVADSHNHGFNSTDYIQCYDSVGNPTSKKQWVPYGGSASHSHTQN